MWVSSWYAKVSGAQASLLSSRAGGNLGFENHSAETGAGAAATAAPGTSGDHLRLLPVLPGDAWRNGQGPVVPFSGLLKRYILQQI